MSDVREIDAAIAVTGLLDADTERRRPDRSPTVNPALLPLLRNPEHLADPASTPALHQDLQDDPGFGDLDDGNPARGIMFAILFSVPIWAVILYLVL